MSWWTLGYRPFFDSMHGLVPGVTEYWLWLLLPLVVGISVVYKGSRVRYLRELPWAALKMSVQILVVMALAAAGLYGLHYVVIRMF